MASISLTNEQKDKIDEIKAKYNPIIKQLEMKKDGLKKENTSTEEIDKRIAELKALKKEEIEPINASRYGRLKGEIDRKMGQGAFEKLKSSFDKQYSEVLKSKNDFKAYREFYYSYELSVLDKWIAEHPEQLVNNDEQSKSHDGSKVELIMEYQGQEIENLDKIIESLQNKVQSIESDNRGKTEGKSGLDDCMQDSAVRISAEQEATKTVKAAVLGKEKEFDENEQQKKEKNMVNKRYGIAIAETLHYLKGVTQDDINKIPNKFMSFLKENASEDYRCEFDYTKPLNELNLKNETRGLIAMICLNYWCETEEQKNNFIEHLNENEKQYQEELRKKYNIDNIFKIKEPINKEKTTTENIDINKLPIKVGQENIFKRVLKSILRFLHINQKDAGK